jgi:hypothetical protein
MSNWPESFRYRLVSKFSLDFLIAHILDDLDCVDDTSAQAE